MSDLESKTRYDPGEVEPRICADWLDRGLFHPDPEGTPDENYSIAIPPPNVTGVAPHGARAQQLDPGHPDPLPPDAGSGRSGSSAPTMRASPPRRRWSGPSEQVGLSREEIGREEFVARVWQWREQYGDAIVEQLKRLGASCDFDDERFTLDEELREGGARGVRRAVPQGLDLPRPLHGQLGPREPFGDLRPRGRGSRGRRTRSTTSTIRWPRARGRSPSPPSGPRRCSPTRRSPCNPEDERYRAADRRDRDPAARRAQAEDHRRRVRQARVRHRRAQDHPGHDPNDFEIGRRHGLEQIA